MRRSTMDLYGVKPEEFADLPYREALKVRCDLAKKRLKIVTRNIGNIDTTSDYSEYTKITYLQYDILKAIKHNERLIDELEE